MPYTIGTAAQKKINTPQPTPQPTIQPNQPAQPIATGKYQVGLAKEKTAVGTTVDTSVKPVSNFGVPQYSRIEYNPETEKFENVAKTEKPSTFSNISNAITGAVQATTDLPILKQFKQGVGKVVGAAGAVIGGAVGGSAEFGKQLYEGKGVMEASGKAWETAADIGKQTAEFGERTGRTAAEGVITNMFGAIPQAVIALPLFQQGYEDYKKGDTKSAAAKTFLGLLSTYGAYQSFKSGGGKIVSNEVLGIPSEKEIQQQAQKKLLEERTPNASIARQKISETGKIVKDKVAQSAISQGIDDADVAVIKTASTPSKMSMKKMLDIREKGASNKRFAATNRASDVVGDTFLEQAKFIEKTNKSAGKALNQVAQKLKGQKIDSTRVVAQLADDMVNQNGIKITKNGKLNFKGSDFENLSSVQSSINNVWNRANRILKKGDAMELHRLKSYIDEVVTYGAETGLKGRASNILKTFRHNIDSVLDTSFPEYDNVNTIYKDTIQELNKIGSSMGSTFKLSDDFANAALGTRMRRVLSNTQSRAAIIQNLESMQSVAKKYGLKIDKDIITEALFADILEKHLGPEAPTGFAGQIGQELSRAQDIATAGADIAKGGFGSVRGVVRTAKLGLDLARGINKENQIKALKNLLDDNLGTVKKSNFGK